MGPLLYTEGVSKSDRLLQTVFERPDDASVLMVYGDALQAGGDPRGALVSVQLQRQRATHEGRRRLLKLQEHQLLSDHARELYGPLHGLERLAAVWRHGFIRELHVRVVRSELERLVAALELPMLALLERLDVQLVRAGELGALIAALPPRLQHLALSGPDPRWEGLLEALPPLPSLELWGGQPSLDFEGLQLPKLQRLRLAHGTFENLTYQVAPQLELLTLGDGDRLEEPPELPAGLRLVRLLGETYGELPLPGQTRAVHEWDPDRTVNEARVIAGGVSRGGWGVAAERSLLLTEASAPQVDDAFAEIEAWLVNFGHQLRCVVVPVGPLRLTAVELRCSRPSKTLLAQFAQALSRRAFTLELAASNSNRDVLLRGYRDERVEPLSMGPYRSREDVWRAGIDHAFGFDPGRTLDLVLEALDAELPRRSNGDPENTQGEWPCVTPLPPSEDPRRYDDYDDEYEDDESPLPDWWSEQLPQASELEIPRVDAPPPSVVEVAEAAEEEEEHATEADEQQAQPDEVGDREWAQVMAETPIELEGDGTERNPEQGLEDQPLDFDAMHLEALDVCFRCERGDLPLETCDRCGHEVCGRCAIADDHHTVHCLRC